MWRTWLLWLVVVAAVVGGSLVSVRLWNTGEEKLEVPAEILAQPEWPPAQIAAQNNLPPKLVAKALALDDAAMKQPLSTLGISPEDAQARIKRMLALRSEEQTKDFRKISLKFGLWIVWLVGVWLLLRKGKIRSGLRVWLYAAAVLMFGVVLGADPGPMGTVSDAVVLFGRYRVVFPPRLIAMTAFLLMVLLANKFICGWGCQAGVLQDLLFRLNRKAGDRPGRGQIKLPFWLTNTVRKLFFVAFVVWAVAWGTNLIEPLDPFRVFKPATMGWLSVGFVGLLLVASVFVYRPWCHLFCPFGFLGWLVEKASVTKIVVDYDRCIACERCAERCPSTVMGAILKRDREIPDCFSCGTCIEVCPTQAIAFKAGKRQKPKEGKFAKK